ncbi:ArsR family transcriptional regulator [Rhodobacter aestuarii]|uniref:Transcriptional regulator, ArsR family n=1 Tax=Rhodobacter aestuarii TaxID=453582 RepID=A0A1N7JXC4_9RHOB|nr:helix-turn-helix domain-containing protein [Rhodobacter aestuarii]PTV95947.1 ArsR family transcriptional regulator [Rhodobacter aestuarii]SIS53999.1 transcriptional regulator, ArsR family [Rhodobacter aestuarii]
MEHDAAARAFATLGHPDRLAALRLILRFAPKGVRPTEIADALHIKPNTLSHHLADLAAAGLVTVTRQGRSLFYAADLTMTEGLIGYLALDLGHARADLMPEVLRKPPQVSAPFHVLFLCTGNSARSVMAEALLRDLGAGRFIAHSAGTRPGPAPNPFALEVLARSGHAIENLFSKPLDGFQRAAAPQMQFVFTLCDVAATEDCPPWPGQPISAHWGLPDPARAEGTGAQKALAFAECYAQLRRRIEAFVALPLENLDRRALQKRLDTLPQQTKTE